MILRYTITEEGYRLKRYLALKGIPDNIFKEIRRGNGQFIVNDQTVDNHYLLKPGDKLELVLPATTEGENIVSVMHDFEILYEDSYLLIINKEPNLACIPTKEHFTSSLANYVLSYYKRTGILANIHFVNRLDAPTSGIVILAKNGYMVHLMQETEVLKQYILETKGIVEPSEGTIELGILKDPDSVIKRYTTTDFINSKTIYKTLYNKDGNSFIEATLCTGKTHQLRLHFLSKGHPIIGDILYGDETPDGILHLHSYHLEFIHPVTKEKISLTTYPSWYEKQD